MSAFKNYLSNLMAYHSINIFYYGLVSMISLILLWILVNNWLEFRRMRVVMSCWQLLITIITIISMCLEPIILHLGLGLSIQLAGYSVLLTPTCLISELGLLICGIANLRLNHRIWRTEFPTRPYPVDLQG